MITLTFTDQEFRVVAALLEAGASAKKAGHADPFMDLALESINARIAEALKGEKDGS